MARNQSSIVEICPRDLRLTFQLIREIWDATLVDRRTLRPTEASEECQTVRLPSMEWGWHRLPSTKSRPLRWLKYQTKAGGFRAGNTAGRSALRDRDDAHRHRRHWNPSSEFFPCYSKTLAGCTRYNLRVG